MTMQQVCFVRLSVFSVNTSFTQLLGIYRLCIRPLYCLSGGRCWSLHALSVVHSVILRPVWSTCASCFKHACTSSCIIVTLLTGTISNWQFVCRLSKGVHVRLFTVGSGSLPFSRNCNTQCLCIVNTYQPFN